MGRWVLGSKVIFYYAYAALFLMFGFVWNPNDRFIICLWFTGLQHLVVTTSGPDRPGIVARLSKRVLDCDGNVEVSRMARLASEFSILMLVTFDVT